MPAVGFTSASIKPAARQKLLKKTPEREQLIACGLSEWVAFLGCNGNSRSRNPSYTATSALVKLRSAKWLRRSASEAKHLALYK